MVSCDAHETKDLSLILLSSLTFHMHEIIPWLQIALSLGIHLINVMCDHRGCVVHSLLSWPTSQREMEGLICMLV